MAPIRIYESDYPTPFLPQISLFDYLLPSAPGISPLPDWDPKLPAFIDGRDGRTLSRGLLRDNALGLGAGLHQLGVRRGSTICIWGYNSLEWVTAAYGSIAGGVTVSPCNYAYAPHEVAHQINDAGADLVFVDVGLLPEFEKARSHLKNKLPVSRVVLLCQPQDKPAGTPYKAISEIFASKPLADAEKFDGANCMATAWMSYSSGTTGLPKGVMTSHWNMTSQLQAANVTYEQLKSGVDVVLGFLPFSHIYGVTISLFQPLTFGVPVVVLPRYEEISVLTAIQKFRVTHALLVPPLILQFVHSKNLDKYDLSSIRNVMCGAAPLSTELCEAFYKRLPNTVIMQGYGMTETTPNVCTMNRSEARARAGWVGRLIPTYQARLVKEDGTEADCAKGESGELWVRSPSVMKGYHNNPTATANTMTPGGWLRTGDILVRDDQGWFKVVDRLKELIKYKGYQVAPAELEALLLQHPNVVDVGVVGVYDELQASELPRAYVVLNTPSADNEAKCKDIQAWVAARVAQHKRLRGGIVVLDAIPKSPSGKILRKDLRERAKNETAAVYGQTKSEARL